MDPIEYAIELRIRQAGRELAEEAQEVLNQIEDGIMARAADCEREIADYLKPAE